MAKFQKGVNDLKTWCLNNGKIGQKLMTEWTGICEDGEHYNTDQISFGSHKKFKWQCSKGHVYRFSAYDSYLIALYKQNEFEKLKDYCKNNLFEVK